MEKKKSSIEDYKVAHTLGKGSFGEVIAVRKGEGELMAMKKIRKELLSKVTLPLVRQINCTNLISRRRSSPNSFTQE